MTYSYKEEILSPEEAQKRELLELRYSNALLSGKIDGMWEMLKYLRDNKNLK